MIKKRETSPKQSFQVLPNNRIDKEIKELVRSFNVPLAIYLSSKYDICNNHIYPNQNKCLFLLSFCRTLFFGSMCLFRLSATLYNSIYIKAVDLVSTEDFVYWFVIILFFMQHIFSYTTLFILDTVHKYNNVNLILRIQTIHNNVNISNSYRIYIICNWISIFIIISTDLSVFTAFYYAFPKIDAVVYILNMLTDWSFFTFDINLIIATRVMVLLRKYLEEWIYDVLRMNEDIDYDEHCHQQLETYQEILEAYNLYKKIFQVLVSLRQFYLNLIFSHPSYGIICLGVNM